MPCQFLDVYGEHLQTAKSPFKCDINGRKRAAVTGNDQINRQLGQHIQRGFGAGQPVSFAEQFGENDPEAIFPERITGN